VADLQVGQQINIEADPLEGYKETDLGLLPEEWEIVQVGDVAKVITGKTPSTREQQYWQGAIPFITPVDLRGTSVQTPDRTITEEGLKVSKSLPPGTVLVSCIGYIGKVGVTEAPASVTNQQINSVLPDEDVFSSWYLAYSFMHWESRLQERAAITTVPILNKRNFEAFEIPLPPLSEQRAIAHILRTIQEAKEATERVITATRELKRSLMNHLFTYGPVSVDGAERVPLKETEVGPVPMHWEVVELGQVITRTQYGLSQRGEAWASYPILRMNNLQEGRVNFHSQQYVDLDEQALEKYKLRTGDLLFNRTNSYELVGKTALFDLEGDYVFASYLIRVNTDESKLDPNYANYYLNAAPTQARLKLFASRGVSQSNINATKLKRLVFPLPPLSEQRKAVDLLHTVDKKVIAEKNRRQTLDVLFKTLLHNLMTGKVRVPDVELAEIREVV